jgi:hypothetical protein
VSSKDVETEVNGFVDSALHYAAEYKGWQLSQQSSRVQYISDIGYSGKQSKETSKTIKKRKHEQDPIEAVTASTRAVVRFPPTAASALEEDDSLYWTNETADF